ncbi:hypothetical protein KNSL1_012294 [Colletotrichum chrysophilum]|nr:hypothetical protein KNSL1_012294 [Colletotrichum chrysophilum]
MGEYFTLKDLEITKKRLAQLKGQQTIYEQIGTWEKRHEMSGDRMLAVIAEAERRRAEGTTESRLKDVLHQSMRDAASDERRNQRYETPDSEAGAVIIEDDRDDVDSVDDVLEDCDGMVPVEYLPGFRAGQHENDQKSSEKDEQYLKPFGLSDFGSYFDMDRQLDYLARLEALEIAKCIVCNRMPVNAVQGKGKCEHIFCSRNCLYPKCRKIFDVEAHSPGKRKGRKEKEYMKGFDYGGFQPYEDDKEGKKPLRFLQISDRKYDTPVTPSAKTVALKETILRWQLEAPDEKIIIFSQFNVCMKVVARMLEAEAIDFAYLSGSMTTEQRKKAVEEFEKGTTVKVLIASLRAGGTALNLTRGNRVVLMELWWNHAVEQQAFARVFRMGQTKETHFLRFIVNTDIEQRMLGMQVDKILAIDAALQDGGPRAPKLSVEDIASLLGKVVRDDTGKMIRVVADYSDEEEDDEDDNEPHSATAAVARLDEEPGLPGFVVPDDELEYEDAEE